MIRGEVIPDPLSLWRTPLREVRLPVSLEAETSRNPQSLFKSLLGEGWGGGIRKSSMSAVSCLSLGVGS